MIAIDVSKQQALDIDQKAIQQINFRANLNRSENVNNNTIMFFIIEEAKKNSNNKIFFTRNCEIIVNVFHNFILF